MITFRRLQNPFRLNTPYSSRPSVAARFAALVIAFRGLDLWFGAAYLVIYRAIAGTYPVSLGNTAQLVFATSIALGLIWVVPGYLLYRGRREGAYLGLIVIAVREIVQFGEDSRTIETWMDIAGVLAIAVAWSALRRGTFQTLFFGSDSSKTSK